MRYQFCKVMFGAVLLATGTAVCLPANAAAPSPPVSPIILDTQIRFQGVDENNADLGTGGPNNTGLIGAEAKFRLTANFNENSLFFWEGRGVTGAGRGGFQTSDTGEISTSNNFLEWRQSYFQFSDLGGQPVTVKAGRQRVREFYGDWWDQDFDGVRVAYDTSLFSGFLMAGQNLFSYTTSEDFKKDDKDIFRTLGEGSWQYHYQQFLEARMMYQDDHSGIDQIGSLQSLTDPNDAKGNLFWAGVRATGKTPSILKNADKIAYRADLMGVSGHEDMDVTTPAGASRLVTDINGRDVLGWAFDGDVDVPIALQSKPVIHLGYAFGSGGGDNNSGADHAFRQSGLEGNFSHLGVLSQNINNYGTVLRPELSNIHIISAGFTMPLFAASDGGIIYHYYRLADAATGLGSSGVSNALNGQDKDLGHAIDLIFNSNLYQDNDQRIGHINKIYLRASLGAFRAGDAYGSNKGEVAGRGLVELGFNF